MSAARIGSELSAREESAVWQEMKAELEERIADLPQAWKASFEQKIKDISQRFLDSAGNERKLAIEQAALLTQAEATRVLFEHLPKAESKQSEGYSLLRDSAFRYATEIIGVRKRGDAPSDSSSQSIGELGELFLSEFMPQLKELTAMERQGIVEALFAGTIVGVSSTEREIGSQEPLLDQYRHWIAFASAGTDQEISSEKAQEMSEELGRLLDAAFWKLWEKQAVSNIGTRILGKPTQLRGKAFQRYEKKAA